MLTLPEVVTRAPTPYYAIREAVSIPFTETIDKAMPEVQRWFAARGVERPGPAIFRYNLINMPKLEMEFGHLDDRKLATGGRIEAGMLPAGRYATLTWFGHYDDLMEVNAVLIGWARLKELRFDAVESAEGDRFAARFELYPNGPEDEPDPSKWETQLFIKLSE